MPHQNRVTPEGDIVRSPARGTMMGNRGGCFHRPDGRLANRRWASRQWLCCVLEFKDRRRPLLRPGRYTELFFLDEATAFSAGHRPCFECRRADALRFATLWATLAGRTERMAASEMDLELHAARLMPDGAKRRHPARLGTLGRGIMVRHGGAAHLVDGGDLVAWSPAGYTKRLAVDPSVLVDVLTPQPTVAIIAAGYAPDVHTTAAITGYK